MAVYRSQCDSPLSHWFASGAPVSLSWPCLAAFSPHRSSSLCFQRFPRFDSGREKTGLSRHCRQSRFGKRFLLGGFFILMPDLGRSLLGACVGNCARSHLRKVSDLLGFPAWWWIIYLILFELRGGRTFCATSNDCSNTSERCLRLCCGWLTCECHLKLERNWSWFAQFLPKSSKVVIL